MARFSLRRFFSGEGAGAERGRFECAVREMAARDLGPVLAIEAESHPNAWSRDDFDRWLAQPHVSAHVLDAGEGVMGFFLVAVEGDHLHVVNLAVASVHRRRGLASRALRAIEGIARAKALERIHLEVRESNLAAQLLYKKSGYVATSILRGYYGDEDGYLMRRELA